MSVYQFPRATIAISEKIHDLLEQEFKQQKGNTVLHDEIHLRIAAGLCVIFEEILKSPTIRAQHKFSAVNEQAINHLLNSSR